MSAAGGRPGARDVRPLAVRQRLAEGLLLEALHRARAWTGEPGPLPVAEPTGGDDPEVDSALTARGRELLHTLWPRPMAPTRAKRLLDVVRRYVDRAEALARRRDRFLHDFRAQHGFDRSAYTPEEAATLTAALADLEAEAGGRLQGAALELLDAPGSESEPPSRNPGLEKD